MSVCHQHIWPSNAYHNRQVVAETVDVGEGAVVYCQEAPISVVVMQR